MPDIKQQLDGIYGASSDTSSSLDVIYGSVHKSELDKIYGSPKEFSAKNYGALSPNEDLITPRGRVVPGEYMDEQEFIESGHNPSAVSKAGAKGLMQMTAAAAKDIGADMSRMHEPVYGRNAGRTYFAKLVDVYDGDMQKAYAAYNAGMGTVSKGLEHLNAEGKEYLHKLRRVISEYPTALHKPSMMSTAKAAQKEKGNR